MKHWAIWLVILTASLIYTAIELTHGTHLFTPEVLGGLVALLMSEGIRAAVASIRDKS